MQIDKEEFFSNILEDTAFDSILRLAYKENEIVRTEVNKLLNGVWEMYQNDTKQLDS